MSERRIETPFGSMLLRADETGITQLCFHSESGADDESELLLQAEEELKEYFAGRRKCFSVPLSMHGTPFREKVWRALCEIPYGETVTYGELAAKIGSPKAARAVGMANHVNPLPVFVPCHRVIGAGGQLTGYAGGLDMKRRLLELEGYYAEI